MRSLIIFALILGLAAIAVACGDDDGGIDATCEGLCPAVVAANCAIGPADVDDCTSGCNGNLGGNCGAEIQAIMDCAVDASYTGDASGYVVTTGCMAQEDAYAACVSGT